MKHYFYLSRKRINAKGLCPIVCRITNGMERRDFRTGLWIEPENWDKKRSWPKNNSKSVAARLTVVQNDICSVIFDCERDKVKSSDEVICRYQNLQQPVLSALDRIAKEYIDTVKPSDAVAKRILLAVKQFEELTGVAKIGRVLPETIKGFESGLFAKKMASSWVVKKLQYLKRLCVYAENKKYITSNAFRLYRFPTIEKVKIIQLTQAEVESIRKYKFVSERLNYVKDLFLFQCYTGLSYSDLFGFSKYNLTHFKKKRFLLGERVKTGEQYFLPWLPEPASIAAKYDYTFRKISNQKYNSYLKEVIAIVGIEKKVSTHTARKTFAQMMIDKGYSAEVVSKMMGHASFSMTQAHYGRIGITRVQNEVLKLAS